MDKSFKGPLVSRGGVWEEAFHKWVLLSSRTCHIISNSRVEGMVSSHSVLSAGKDLLPQLQGIAVCKQPSAVSPSRDCCTYRALPHQRSGLASKDCSMKAQCRTQLWSMLGPELSMERAISLPWAILQLNFPFSPVLPSSQEHFLINIL